ncbi:Uncharacterised protein [Burkholderia pseudomallei]|uniref:hypothetical protein n=1 Tax=Burkholderia pseudomallei TaxID=28450 RepID=UPI000F1613E5|nr:hypothetical protein [Burkholderia pseudomallei]VBP71129.1 Uncharacterised protein [Burkholderia pseudomallei]
MTERTKKEERLMIQIEGLRAELERKCELLREERKRNCGVRVGDIVTYRGDEYRVKEIEISPYGGVSLRVNPKKKNGEFGNNIFRLYSKWEHTGRHAPASEEEQK